ncbi:MAG TPA: alpha/beta hydrolase [Actinomycetota bacterium]|nr:alpha/beta hydrolase [Actinomycetota bacterium]
MILAHEVAGSGPARTAGWGPALLLVHAGIADRRMWDEQMGPFTEAGWTVIRADLPGFGETGPPARPVALWATLRDLLDHLGVERAVVVGASLGGRAAVDLALAAPDRVRALVLIGSSLAGHPFQEPALFELWDQSEGAIERGDHQEAARVEIDTWVVGRGRDPSAVDPEVRRRVRDMLLVAYEHGEADLEEPDPPAAGRLGEVAAPALVVVGEHDRPDIHAMAGALAAGIPRAERALLPGTAHLPSMERPEACNQVVLEFLAKLGPGA